MPRDDRAILFCNLTHLGMLCRTLSTPQTWSTAWTKCLGFLVIMNSALFSVTTCRNRASWFQRRLSSCVCSSYFHALTLSRRRSWRSFGCLSCSRVGASPCFRQYSLVCTRRFTFLDLRHQSNEAFFTEKGVTLARADNIFQFLCLLQVRYGKLLTT